MRKETFQEAKAILADMSVARNHPETLHAPEKNTPRARQIMHLVHRGIHSAGVRLNVTHQRKQPEWSAQPEPDVIGYGGEKIAYKITGPDGLASVLSIYHKDSLMKQPADLIEQKQTSYETYRRYFSDIVLPTEFIMVDNPWGEGQKPASLQSYLDDATLLSDMNAEQIAERRTTDEVFDTSIQTLRSGYAEMLVDGMCPDFGNSNVVVTKSGIQLFDTGVIYQSSALKKLKPIQPNYDRIEKL